MNLKRLASAAIVATASLVSGLDAAPVMREVHETMEGFIASKEIAGSVTAVISPDRFLHLEAQGFANIEKQEPLKTDAAFWIASMTKPITGVAIVMLIEEGKLSLDDAASKYLPELGAMKNADGSPAKAITVRHLLTHTAGLPENTREETRAAKSLQDLVRTFTTRPMSFEPGTKWAYSQTAINSLGRIVEVLSGEKYEDYLDARIFRPLGMNDTTFYPSKELQQRLATSYKLEDGKLIVTDIYPFTGRDLASRDRVPLANGGLFSTAADYASFMQMLLNEGEVRGQRILKPESVKLISTIHTGELTAGFIPGSGWGLGVTVVREPGNVSAALSPGSYGHGGAYGTQAWIDPVKKVGYLLLVQRANFPNSDASDVRKGFQDAAAKAMK